MNTIAENIMNALNANKSISMSLFYPDGEITSENKLEAKNHMNSYNKALSLLAVHLKQYAVAYFTNGEKFPTKTTLNVLKSDVKECARHLYILELSDNKALYCVKVMCNLANTFKKTDESGSKSFTADFTAKGIKRPFEKALAEALNHDYAENVNNRENFQTENAINKVIKEAKKAAMHGRSKAMINHLNKLAEMVSAERFASLETEIKAAFVEVVKPTSEAPLECIATVQNISEAV